MERTIAIIDFAHAGTTMTAGVCEILGIPMVGRRYTPMQWEDLDIIEALKDEDRLSELVKRRNWANDLWGFKYPGAWKFQPLLEQHLRNPVYLAIFKEPVSVTARRFGAVTPDKVLNTVIQFEKAVEGMKATTPNVHFLSYLHAVVDPAGFVRRIVELTSARPTPGQADCAIRFIQPACNPRRRYPEVAPWI